MKNRNVFAVFALPFITFGIYGIYWVVKTKGEMNKLGADIPTAWLVIIPIVNIWWLWKYCEGVDIITNNRLSTPIAFLLVMLLGTIGYAVIQNDFNNLAAAPAPVYNNNPITDQNQVFNNEPIIAAPISDINPTAATVDAEPMVAQPPVDNFIADVTPPASDASDFGSSDSSSDS